MEIQSEICPCPSCGSGHTYKMPVFRLHSIRECDGCGLWFSSDMSDPGEEFYKGIYAAEKKSCDQLSELRTIRSSDFETTLVELLKLFNNDSQQVSILDWGCGVGEYVKELSDLGYDAVGFERNSEIVNHANNILYQRTLLTDSIKEIDRQFDFVLAIQVLEHLPNPLSFLISLREYMHVRSKVIVYVPNMNFFRIRKDFVNGNLPDGNYPPHHLTFWSKRSLVDLFNRAGFQLLSITESTYPYLDSEGKSWWVGATKAIVRNLGWLGGPSLIAVAVKR